MAVKTAIKNSYEVLVILRPNLSEKDLSDAIQQLETTIKNYGGNITRLDEPQRKRLTHKIKTFKDGYYVSVLFDSPAELPNTLKRTLSISDNVVRYIVVKKRQ